MKPFFTYLFLISFFTTFGQTNKKICKITFDTRGLKLDRKNVVIVLDKFRLDSFNHRSIVKRISPTSGLYNVNFRVDDPFYGSVTLYYHDTIFTTSGDFIISNEPIEIKFEKYVSIKSKQNDFASDNRFLFLALPAVIYNNPQYSSKLVRRSYELKIPENRILEAQIEEYERNVVKQVKANKDFYFTLNRLYSIKESLSLKTLDGCLSILLQNFKGTSLAASVQRFINQSKNLYVGTHVPSFMVVDVKNMTAQPEKAYGKYSYTYIDFWASWCKPCREEMNTIRTFDKNIDTSKLHIITVSLDEKRENWISAMKQDTLIWSSYWDSSGGWKGDVAKAFNLTYIPRTFIVDRNGTIVAFDVSGKELWEFVKEKRLTN